MRKNVKLKKTQLTDKFIFPDNIINTNFKSTLNDLIDQQYDKLPINPSIVDYYLVTNEIKKVAVKHTKTTYYTEQAKI